MTADRLANMSIGGAAVVNPVSTLSLLGSGLLATSPQAQKLAILGLTKGAMPIGNALQKYAPYSGVVGSSVGTNLP